MVDNSAPSVYCVAVSADTVAAYQAGIDQLKTVDCRLVVPLKSGAAIEQYAKAHAEERSGDTVGKERVAVLACASGLTVGDVETADTILYWIASMTGSKRVLACVPNAARFYVNSWQGTDGGTVDGPYEVAHYYYAADYIRDYNEFLDLASIEK
jgi:hypothetical protein